MELRLRCEQLRRHHLSVASGPPGSSPAAGSYAALSFQLGATHQVVPLEDDLRRAPTARP